MITLWKGVWHMDELIKAHAKRLKLSWIPQNYQVVKADTYAEYLVFQTSDLWFPTSAFSVGGWWLEKTCVKGTGVMSSQFVAGY
jgi:hypothetical protein